MANGYGYEFMDLGNPSALGEPLSRGGGRIAFPSGQVQDYQFNPPSIEDQNEALRLAAQRASEFDIQKREAEEMRALMDDLIQSSKVDDASKVVEQASKFQAIRKFDRNFREAKQRGMDDTTATIYAAQRNLPMLTSSAQGAVIDATRQPSEFRSSTGEPFAIGPTGTFHRLTDPNAAPRPVDLGSGRQGAVFGGRLYPFTPPTAEKSDTSRVSSLQREIAAREKLRESRKRDWDDEQLNLFDAETARMSGIVSRSLGVVQNPQIGNVADGQPDDASRAEARRQMLEQQVTGGVPHGIGGATGTIIPLPKNKADLEQGGLYDTPKGVMRWTGDRFVPVQTR